MDKRKPYFPKYIIQNLPDLPPVKEKLNKTPDVHLQRDPEQELKDYKNAIDLNRKLSVHANKFRKSKFLLLFGVLEKDEQNVVTDALGDEDAEIIGTQNI